MMTCQSERWCTTNRKVDISGESGGREPVRENTPPGVFVKELLRKFMTPKPDPKIASPIKIELPTDTKTRRIVCSLDEIATHEAGLQRAYPVIIGTDENVVALMVGNDRDREAVVKWYPGEMEKARQAAPNGYRLREFVWRDRGTELKPWTAVLEPFWITRRRSARSLNESVDRLGPIASRNFWSKMIRWERCWTRSRRW